MNFGEEERETYEERLEWLRVEANTLKKYEEKGRAEGEQIGLKKFTRTILRKGLSFSEISELTGLTKEDILNLSQK